MDQSVQQSTDLLYSLSFIYLLVWRSGYSDFMDYRDERGEVILKANVSPEDTRELKLSNMIVIGSKLRKDKYHFINPLI